MLALGKIANNGPKRLLADAGKKALENESEQPIARVSTRQWAQDWEYDPQKLFQKFFNDDITYLLSMHNLWKNRRAPTPLDWKNLPDAGKNKD